MLIKHLEFSICIRFSCDHLLIIWKVLAWVLLLRNIKIELLRISYINDFSMTQGFYASQHHTKGCELDSANVNHTIYFLRQGYLIEL